jgi:hypothetical protein
MDDLTQQYILQKDFWIAISAIAATFAGFTLAGYSIYITRTEMAASDPMCRRYNFRECTSSYSLYFMFYALMMFMAPLLLGIIFLSRVSFLFAAPRHFLMVGILSILVPFIVVIVVSKQILYIWHGAKYYRKVTRYDRQLLVEIIERKEEKDKGTGTVVISGQIQESKFDIDIKELRIRLKEAKDAERRNKRKEIWMLGLCVLLLISLLILLANVGCILLALSYPQDWYLTAVGDPKQASILALIMGTILVCCYFHIFQPERFLFRKDETTKQALESLMEGLPAQLESIKQIQGWIQERVEATKSSLKAKSFMKEKLNDGAASNREEQEGREKSKTEKLLDRAEIYSKGESTGLIRGLGGLLSDERQKYHMDWIDFCSKQEVITYEGIVWIVSGVNQYVEGLNRFENGLKEVPVQLKLLSETHRHARHLKLKGFPRKNSNHRIVISDDL